MNKQYDDIKMWFNTRNFRERVILFIVGLVLIYGAWNLLIKRSLAAQKIQLTQAIDTAQTQIKQLQQGLDTISTMISKGFSNQNIQQQTLSAKNFPKIMQDILQQQGVALIDLKSLPDEPWIPQEMNTAGLPEKTKQLYKHRFRIEFHNNYVNTIDYFSRMEKLPWHLYWETLEYKVLTYPEASVVAEFYVLTNRQSEI